MVISDVNFARFVVQGSKHAKPSVWSFQKGSFLTDGLTPTGCVSVSLTPRQSKSAKNNRAEDQTDRNIWISYGDSTCESGIKSESTQRLHTVLLWSGSFLPPPCQLCHLLTEVFWLGIRHKASTGGGGGSLCEATGCINILSNSHRPNLKTKSKCIVLQQSNRADCVTIFHRKLIKKERNKSSTEAALFPTFTKKRTWVSLNTGTVQYDTLIWWGSYNV